MMLTRLLAFNIDEIRGGVLRKIAIVSLWLT
jgi:hypothetical protein